MSRTQRRIVYFCCLHFGESEILESTAFVTTIVFKNGILYCFSDINMLAVVAVVLAAWRHYG